MIAYHIDRTNSLKEGDIIELQIFDDIKPAFLGQILNSNYPEGLSRHGGLYYISQSNQVNMKEFILENLLEYERLLKFPDKVSRFESFFASQTLDEALIWKSILSHNPLDKFTIWEVEFNHENYLHLDSSWLYCDIYNFSPLYTAFFANKYWSGETSENPKMELLIKPPIKIVKKVNR
ncbi:MAG TPA: hypothetical protein GX707_15795 [Epulopiscium sp.]|nr:hypothetical protein [Candidatus Epulonipiscium sp.]